MSDIGPSGGAGGLPRRDIARALVFDPADRLFLIAYEAARDVDPARPGDRAFWFMPGGGLEAGETHEAACRRELEEEIGVRDVALGPQVAWCDGTFTLFPKGRDARERYFVVRLSDDRVDTARLAETEDNPILDARWWSLDDLAALPQRVEPAGLVALARRIVAGDVPPEPVRLTWVDARP